MGKIKIFLDTDVIIASLLSKTKTGAAYLIINNESVEKVVSQSVVDELKYVIQRHNISNEKTKRTISKITVLKPEKTKAQISKDYKKYVSDIKDAHVLAGALRSKASFLITFNTKHYLKNAIKNNFGIIIKKPGEILQHLRLN